MPGNTLTLAELQELAQSVGFPDPSLAAAVAMAESGGHVQAIGDTHEGNSVGLWQINLPSHPEYDATKLLDPTYNARAALAISQNGTQWSPWTTFRTGAYRAFLVPMKRALTTGQALLLGLAVVGACAAGAWLLTSDAPPAPRRRRLAHRNPAPRDPMQVQSLLFRRDAGWTPARAKRWARGHGFRSGDVETTDDMIHLRQFSPEGLEVIRTKSFGRGISARVGR